MPFAVVGPSGVGKATILSRVLERVPGLALVKSLTSRPERPDDGTLGKYRYVSQEEFQALIGQNAFLEWAEVHGHYYGTTRAAFEEAVNCGKDPILEIDVQGAKNIKAVHPETVLIFVAPPNFQALRQRLHTRSSEPEEEIQARLKDAKREMQEAGRFDYLVINDQLEAAVKGVESIIVAERLKTGTVIEGLGEDSFGQDS
jgi:guanylate kinase